LNEIFVKVSNKTKEAEDICSYDLVNVDGEPLPAFTAGAHIDVHITDDLVRQYSLCNDPRETHRYQIAVLRDPSSRGGSHAMHDKVSVGDMLRISAPRNHFGLSDAPKTLLLAGGIGITPILCMAEELQAADQPFEMHYSARSPERTAFLSRLSNAPFVQHLQMHFDSGEAGQKLDLPAVLARQPFDTRLYVCGPSGFITYVVDSAKKAGWSDDRVHREFFGLAVHDAAQVDAPFEVKVASTGTVYLVPTNRSMLDVLLENGVEVEASCEAGVCGTCLTRVLEGVPDHRDVYMSDTEHAANDQVTVCCSRAKSALLVLDL
jgi:vanillate O-demethylase ferredoxin subunit